MSHLIWDKLRERRYETGVDHGVLYPRSNNGIYSEGVPWNGLISVTENPSGAEPTAFWADNAKYLNLLSAEDFGCTIEAYSYPRAFNACLGKIDIANGVTIYQQARKGFGFSYRTIIGNAEVGDEYSYKIHVVYGCMASPPSKNYVTVNASPEAITLSWEVTTTPIRVDNAKPTSHLVFDGSIYKKNGIMNVLHAIEDVLYGTDNTDPRMITLEELPEIYAYHRFLRDSEGDLLLTSSGESITVLSYD